MAGETIRILSDIHYGERASRVNSLAQLRPLLDGATRLVLNGDTFDTRPGPHPELTEQTRAEVRAFFSIPGVPVTFLTGNHDPDLSAEHLADLAGGRVFVTHGDILFRSIVPWGQDAALIRRRMAAALGSLREQDEHWLEAYLQILRRVAASIPQRHQAERHRLKYTLRLAKDTLWPPSRIVKIMRSWREAPGRARKLLRHHRPGAGFVIIGHTHWPGVWASPSGATVVNTGSFCRPFGALTVDLTPGWLTVRRVACRGGEYRLGEKIAAFAVDGPPL